MIIIVKVGEKSEIEKERLGLYKRVRIKIKIGIKKKGKISKEGKNRRRVEIK